MAHDVYAWIDPFDAEDRADRLAAELATVEGDAFRAIGLRKGDFVEAAMREVIADMTWNMGQSWGASEGVRIARAVAERSVTLARSSPTSCTVEIGVFTERAWNYAIRADLLSVMREAAVRGRGPW